VQNAEIARILGEIADLLEMTGGNPFKVRAYRRAAQVIDLHPGPVADAWRTGKLTELPGIGAGIGAKIGELVDSGACREHDRLAALVPPGVLEMLRIEGIGPVTAGAAWKRLGIEDLGGLEEACLSGRIQELPGMGEEVDLLGDLHVHSTASSDGRSSIEELAASGRRLGRRYIAITDHSRSRPFGLDAEELAAHARAVRDADARIEHGPRLLAGIEVDILPSGALDLPDEALAGLDVVVAEVHARLHDPAERTTARIGRALRSGRVHVLAHPTGRQIGTRDGYALDLDRVLETARAEGVALEVNAMPERLDLPDVECRRAKAAGVPLVISTDAHDAAHLANLRYGVWVARRGWLEAKDVLNTLPVKELRRRFARRMARRALAAAR
jgi:DNA polymerase (family 10)